MYVLIKGIDVQSAYQKIYNGFSVALLSMQRSFKVEPLLIIFSLLPRICETASARTTDN